jgi:rRNA maturation RNase YbeY
MFSRICFFSQHPSFTLKQQKQIQEWIKKIVQNESNTLIQLNFIFCTDDYLLQINRKHLNHSSLTDVISFWINDFVEGEVYISIDRVKENALEQKTSFNEELPRVIIHGVLHLLGFKDKSPKEKKEMREKENQALALLVSRET